MSTPIIPQQGWHVLHLFYQIDHGQWSLLDEEDKRLAKTEFTRLVQEIRSTTDTQLLVFSTLTPRADIAFMLLTPDLQKANAFEKQLTLALGPDILHPVYSYLSMTELSEYTPTSEQHAEVLKNERGLEPGSEEFKQALAEFEKRMADYNKHRLYPVLPDWPVMCFYHMNKRRTGDDNWYSLDFETRRKLMAGHARVGRQYSGRILQLITGSTGLDDAEWGVTLFAHNTEDIKSIVYEMRFDEVSARYGEFGEFFIGLHLPLDELFRRVNL